MQWISVKDRLPEIGEVVLLYQTYPKDTAFNCRADPLERNFTKIGGLRYDENFISYENQYSDHPLFHISHWMPLPEKPKKDE
jgi:hypothetical protein